jgi:hypothetical protein
VEGTKKRRRWEKRGQGKGKRESTFTDFTRKDTSKYTQGHFADVFKGEYNYMVSSPLL